MALRNRPPALFLPMRVWDLPTRLFHWGIVLLIPAAYVSSKLHLMGLHMALGHAMLALLLFRWAWGWLGSDTARFARFLGRPAEALRQLGRIGRRETDTTVGHNAACGWMALLMLVLLTVQVGAGLGARDGLGDGGASAGPLARYVGPEWSDRLARVHSVTFQLTVAAVVLHVLAVLAYAVFKRQDLIRPMITGKKRLPGATRAPRLASPLLALAILVAAGAVALVVATQL